MAKQSPLKPYRSSVSFPRKSRYLLVSDHRIDAWYGMNTVESDLNKVPDGQTPDSLNWYTGDANEAIILRRGTHILGITRQTGPGAITGLGVASDVHGNQVPFYTYGAHLRYYNAGSGDTQEIGSSIIPLAAQNEPISIQPYQNLAGYWCYLSSPHWDIVKIPVSNPSSYVLQGSVNFKGHIKFGQSRLMLFNNLDVGAIPDNTGLYMSSVDETTLNNLGTQYTVTGNTTVNSTAVSSISSMTGIAVGMLVVGVGIAPSTTVVSVNSGGSSVTLSNNAVSNQTGTTLVFSTSPFPFVQTTNESVGSLGSQTYNYTLATVSGRKTCFQISVTATVGAGTETFTDGQDGTLLSNFGGTGTVNYATGAISVTFSAVTTGNVTVNYYTEDAASGGIVNFGILTSASSGTTIRIPGSGRYFSQFDGGSFQSIQSLTNVFYCFHTKKTYQITIPTNDDDTGTSPSTNLPYREKMGVSGLTSTYSAPEGVYYVNSANPSKPQVYLLKPYTSAAATNTAIPTLISDALNLAGYGFNTVVVRKWGWYVLVCCQNIVNGVIQPFNSRTFMYNTRNGAWDLLDLPSSCLEEWNGQLLSGDPLTNNIWQLFTGFDDDNAIINNYYTSGNTNHGIPGMKLTKRMVIQGLIQASQNVAVSVSLDNGGFSEVFRIVGSGSYVNTAQPTSVGSYTLGSKQVGGVTQVIAFPFEVEFSFPQTRYEYSRYKLQACVTPVNAAPSPTNQQGGGYVQINSMTYKTQFYKGLKTPSAAMQLP